MKRVPTGAINRMARISNQRKLMLQEGEETPNEEPEQDFILIGIVVIGLFIGMILIINAVPSYLLPFCLVGMAVVLFLQKAFMG